MHRPLENVSSRREFLRRLTLGAAVCGGSTAVARLAGAAEISSGKKLGVALVGLGRYSTGQLGPALRQTQLCRLAGVVTGDPKNKGAAWAKEYGFPEKNIYTYDTMMRMADNPDIDIVYVVTPNGLHARDAVRAAQAGKHVISEKPMANTVAECDAMIAACRDAGRKLSIGYRLHYDPYHKEMVRLANDANFGPFTKMTGKRAFVMGTWRWRADKKLAGGGPLMDLGIYLIQAACMVNNEQLPVAVTAHEEPKKRPDISKDTEETIRWTMEFSNGSKADFLTSYQDSGDTFRAEGDKGWIHFKEHAFTYRGMVVETSRGPLHFDPPVNQQALQMDAFADCILNNRESIVPGEMGRRDLKIIEAIYEAARTGRRVSVSG